MRTYLFVLCSFCLIVSCATAKSVAPPATPNGTETLAVTPSEGAAQTLPMDNSGLPSSSVRSAPAKPQESPPAETPRRPTITIAYPNEFWEVLPPEKTPQGCAQYAVHRVTGAEVDIRVFPAAPAEFIKAAAASMKKNGAQLSEIAVSADGSAASVNFTIVQPKETIKGKLTAVAPKALPGAAFVFFGIWPEKFDKSMIKEFDAISNGVIIK
jgi:hypothetical protein